MGSEQRGTAHKGGGSRPNLPLRETVFSYKGGGSRPNLPLRETGGVIFMNYKGDVLFHNVREVSSKNLLSRFSAFVRYL